MIKQFVDRALNFIFPPICGVCGKFADNYICIDCMERLNLVSKSVHEDKNKDEIEHFWLFKYDDIRELMLRYKFNECSYIHITFSELILNNEKIKEILRQADYIIPVPIHRQRLKERGYNQCELIARRLAENIDNLKCLSNVLGKKRNNVPQSTLKKEERARNIQDAFYIRKYIDLKDKVVIVFDDIYTTGSTIKECIKILKTLECRHIYALTIAKD